MEQIQYPEEVKEAARERAHRRQEADLQRAADRTEKAVKVQKATT